ncbi:NAD(P)H-dependent oxidoreductase [Candidatus Symbiopectobacterium sp. NZEC127]|uniref:NAD(P)H-dependent oxidoreductase n=1 Tax=Candidatus Symbiopectobacterium sp. NZEC127 TaxID=2820472 RepID=UPI0022267682|nr:NAD(P)H-dependent oxidoreductase [Candidatus Symbiopectobacterium sp. NZEC127]MCW2485790.1 NAD(P)H-dependent oxidoreductase [Candidatus Symbiopectobacterium sp. NZEC127]
MIDKNWRFPYCKFVGKQSDTVGGVAQERRDFIKAGLVATAAAVLPGFATGAIGAAQPRVKNVLIINAHQTYPGLSEGALNREYVALIKNEMDKKGYRTQQTYIEKGYNINEEVQKHLWADIIITQSPVFWFGTPWLYKKYVDEVFTAGMSQQSFLIDDGRIANDPSKQYGTGGKLHGKTFLLSLTMNTPKEAFDDPAQRLYAGRSLEDLFSSTTAVYKFCGFAILPVFGSFDVIKAPQIAEDKVRLKRSLAGL